MLSQIVPQEMTFEEAIKFADQKGQELALPSSLKIFLLCWQEALILQRLGTLNLDYPIRLADYKGSLTGEFNKFGTSFKFKNPNERVCPSFLITSVLL